ncbi:MAG: hypothetical protein IJQ07_06710 [Clostridia bacterium]|nr:hypothetical protein [Clostridia bacterium]
MNKILNYQYMIDIISNLHSFIDESEIQIKKLYSDFYATQNALKNKHAGAVEQLTQQYNAQHKNVKKQAEKIIEDAQKIYDEIIKLEEDLSSCDKYFIKTRSKTEQELLNQTVDTYNDTNDYFKILEDVKEQFQSIVVKYSNRKHKGIVDGINYMMSSKRKKDYVSLIVLKNTVKKVIEEINNEVPSVTNDSLADFDKDFLIKRDNIEQSFTSQTQQLQNSFNNNIEQVANNICNKLDEILPDELVGELVDVIDNYNNNYGKIDAQRTQFANFVIIGYLVYPFVDFIESSVLLSLIKSKCEKLIADNVIRLPIMCALNSEFNWMIENDEMTSSNVEKFTHSLMFSFLSFSPIAKIKFSIVDVENRGNSVLPFLEFKKRCPEMFYEKVLTSQEEVRERLYNLNNYIDDFIQNKLGNKYQNIFEYNSNNPKDVAPTTLMVLYDFPKGFDEGNIVELKNILKNGSKCGIFTLIIHNKKVEQTGYYNLEEHINAIKERCSIIKYVQGVFCMNGLELIAKNIPSSQDVNSFADKYMLIMEGKNNEGIVLPSIVKNLIKIKDETKINKYIDEIIKLQKQYVLYYGKISEDSFMFPERIMLGSVQYPVEIFPKEASTQLVNKGFSDKHNNKVLQIPFTCDFNERFNVLMTSNDDDQEYALKFSHVLMMNFLSFVPYGDISFSVFDPEKRGNSIIPYLDFRKKAPAIFDSQIYTTQDLIYERLNYFNGYIDEFIQEKLGNRYANIVEYNMDSTSKQEPIHVLMFYDFPKGFDNRSYDLLINILKNGNKCGIYTFIYYNTDITVSRYDNHEEYLEQIKKISTCVEYANSCYTLSPYNLQVSINNLLSSKELQDFGDEYVKIMDKKKSKGLSFEDIFSKDMFKMDSSKNLTIPMGVGDGNSIISLVMGEGSSHHGLIAGATGSGKSTLLHTIIMSSMLNYTPDKLNLYLMDFKSGTEFKIYESVKLPHIKLLALDAMQEFGESILENLVSEMERRGELFKSVGQTSLKGYSENTGKSLPRILVVMDEFQILFNDSTNRKIALNCAELTKRIVTEGRAFGIHLLMATQSTKVIRDLTLQQGTIEQMRIRIGLKCGEDDARYLFSDKNDAKALEMMKGPIGTAVLNREYIEDSNIGFRAAYCNSDLQQKYLQLIADKFKDIDSHAQIFEGNRTTNMVDYLLNNNIGKYESSITKIYLGDKIKVAPPFVIDVDRRRKHNTLICGSNERMAENLLNQYMLSVALNCKTEMYCIDGDVIVGDRSYQAIYDVFAANCSTFNLAENRGDIITIVRNIYEKFNVKKKTNSDDSIFVFIKNLQWLDIVQKMLKDETIDESAYIEKKEDKVETESNPFDWGLDDATSNESVSYMLRRMIDEGSSCGIYFIFSSTEYTVVKESMYYSENILSKIPERIIFSLSDNDADNLIDGVSVSQMKDNTVYFTDGIKNTFQFKPYVIKGADEIKTIIERR